MRGLALALLFLVALAAAGSVRAQSPQSVSGVPETGAALVDPDYGVSVRALGLRREVQMYQWVAQGEDYREEWREELIDSSSFPAEHSNPVEPPYGSMRWLAVDARLDGRVVSTELLSRLDGWIALPADAVAASLPSNLAMVFQPAGAWLSTSVDPDAPRVGDLRVRWWQLPPGPMQVELVDIDGTWQPAGPEVEVARGEQLDPAPLPADGIPGLPGRERGGGLMVLLGWLLIAFVLAGGTFLIWRRGRSSR